MDEIFDEQGSVPFFGTLRDLEALKTLVSNCLRVLREATSAREMVLETWLTVDYAVRQFLLSGFDLSRFCDEELDLQYRLLPRDFSGLLNLLRYTKEFSARLPPEPHPPKPDKTGGFRASAEFWHFVRDRSPELMERIRELQHQYILAKNPGMPPDAVAAGSCFFAEPKPEVARMSVGWRQVACTLDEEWFKSAEQLNRARNVAAHSFRTQEISRELGLAGPNVLALTRGKCLQIIRTLLGVKGGVAHEQP